MKFTASVSSDLCIVMLVALFAAIAGMYGPVMTDALFSFMDFG